LTVSEDFDPGSAQADALSACPLDGCGNGCRQIPIMSFWKNLIWTLSLEITETRVGWLQRDPAAGILEHGRQAENFAFCVSQGMAEICLLAFLVLDRLP
jgi:hypothetical protein